MSPPVRIVALGAPEDHLYMQTLLRHLAGLEQAGVVAPWSDSIAVPGEDFAAERERRLADAELVLLLVSPHLVASESLSAIVESEVARRGGVGGVLPILVSHVHVPPELPFARLRCLPRVGRFISGYDSIDHGWSEVVHGISEAARSLRQRHQPPSIAEGRCQVVLLDIGRADRWRLAKALAPCLGQGAAACERMIDGAPLVVRGQVAHEEALRLWHTLWGLGAVVRVDDPARGPRRRDYVHLGGELTMVRIEPGELRLNGGRLLKVDREFLLAAWPVTQRLYRRVMGSNPSHFQPGDEARPVERVCWEEASGFCRALDGRAGPAAKGYSFRLPTEHEWEYACRAGVASDGGPHDHWPEIAWACKTFTNPVGRLSPNAWGLFDMRGNIREWVEDRWSQADVGVDLVGDLRVCRGGGYASSEQEILPGARAGVPASARLPDLGFRVAASAMTADGHLEGTR